MASAYLVVLRWRSIALILIMHVYKCMQIQIDLLVIKI